MLKSVNDFSLALGLVDYLIPIIYCTFGIFTYLVLKQRTKKYISIVFLVLVFISAISGLTMPTVKALIGLKILPETDSTAKILFTGVVIVNSALLVEGITILISTFKFFSATMSVVALPLLLPNLTKSSSQNMVAIIIGLIGYILIFISIYRICKDIKYYRPMIFVALSACSLISLALLGIFGDVYQAYTHWIIETVNICAQSFALCSMLFIYRKVKLDQRKPQKKIR